MKWDIFVILALRKHLSRSPPSTVSVARGDCDFIELYERTTSTFCQWAVTNGFFVDEFDSAAGGVGAVQDGTGNPFSLLMARVRYDCWAIWTSYFVETELVVLSFVILVPMRSRELRCLRRGDVTLFCFLPLSSSAHSSCYTSGFPQGKNDFVPRRRFSPPPPQ